MFLLKKSIGIAISVILALAISIVAGVYYISYDNIENREKDYKNKTYNVDEILLYGWQRNGNSYVAIDDEASITLKGIDGYVNNVWFNGYISDLANKKIKVFYTDDKDTDFSEDKVIEVPLKVKGQKLYFNVDKTVSNIKVQLYEETQKSVKIRGFEINPRKFNLSFSISFSVFTVIFATVCLVVAIIKRSKIKAYYYSYKKYNSLLKNLIERDLKVKYRRSALGIMWSVLNPLLMMLVISAVFANVFKFDIKDFPIYYITGAWIFNFVSEATSSSLSSVIGAAPLIKKVYIPKYIFPLEKCLFSFVNMVFSLIAVAIVYAIFGVQLHWTILLFPVIMIYALIFSIGLSLVLSTYNVFFRDIGHLYSVWITAWMYFTPIIYPINALPEAMIKIIKLNPLYYYVEYAREIMIYGNIPSLTQNIICIGFSLIILVIGLFVFNKKQDKFILYI